MGRAETSAEAFAVARARNAVITLGIVYVGFWALLSLVGLTDSTEADAATTRTLTTKMLVGAVIWFVLAFGMHRVWTAAWVVMVLTFAVNLVLHLVRVLEYPSVTVAVLIMCELAVANRLLAADACRAFVRLRRPRLPWQRAEVEPEPEVGEPVWRMPTVAPIAMAEPVAETPATQAWSPPVWTAPPAESPAPAAPPASPKPAPAFDYFA